uniref:Superfamily I DNA and RNA helicase-like protein n=1 Tax=Cyanothece sp. (strain PCC 7425 / ATCC 29141) TaxID=395961 RepID=B8HQ23_CYAP4
MYNELMPGMYSSTAICVTPIARRKLQALHPKARSRFLTKIRRIVNGQVCAEQVKQIGSSTQEVLLRIRYNLNHRIIASLLKPTDAQRRWFKILDFVSHSDMDGGRFSRSDRYTYLDIDDPQESRTPDQDVINQTELWQPSYTLEPKDFELSNADFWFHSIAPEVDDPDLLLSSEQQSLVEAALPILLSGGAGSGKTVIAIYKALEESSRFQERRVLYVTYSKSLKRYAQKIAGTLYGQELTNLEFYDYTELCQKLWKNIGRDEPNFQPSNKITLKRFTEQFYQTRNCPFDPVELWREIRCHLKGSIDASGTATGLIPEEVYLKFARNRGGEEIYKLADQYQSWLKSQNCWDEIDLAKELLQRVDLLQKNLYFTIYCDEVQDLTEVQIKLLFALQSSPGSPQFFLSGDPEQVINPSGFSWKSLKTVIHDCYNSTYQWQQIRNCLNPYELTINFRSVNTIVDLGRAVLAVIHRQHPEVSSDIPCQHADRTVFDPQVPLVVHGSEALVLGQHHLFGADNAIIVTNEREKEKLIEQFSQDGIRSERILTVQEAKGLEFSEVLIWKFFSGFQDWSLRRHSTMQELEKYKFNCLYVAITRARNKLYFYDPQPDCFWQNSEIQSLVEVVELPSEHLDSFFVFNVDECLKAARAFEDSGNFKQAIENYRRAGRADLAQRAEASLLEQEGDDEQAGDLWDRLKNWSKALECWQEIHPDLWQQKWQSLTPEHWLERGDYFKSINQLEPAFYCYDHANNFDGKAYCLDTQEQWERLGDLYQQAGYNDEAKAAYDLAVYTAKQAGNRQHLAIIYQKVDRWQEAAELWQQLQQWQAAARAWQQVNDLAQAAKCYESVQQWDQAASRWQTLQEWAAAGANWYRYGDLTTAAECYQTGECWSQAAQVWEELKNWPKAGRAWLKIRDLHRAAACYRFYNRETWDWYVW